MSRFISSYFLVLFLLMTHSVSAAQDIDLITFESSPIGKYLVYFPETPQTQLSLEQAKKVFDSKQVFSQGGQNISRGIYVEPTWFKTTINNRSSLSEPFRLSVETPWLDYIDVYTVNEQGNMTHIRGGDHLPITEQPVFNRFFAANLKFESGKTDLYIRIQTESVLAVPIKLSTVKDAVIGSGSDKFQYGFLYGILVALALYNAVLYFYIRRKEFGLYVLYILGFVFNSLSYTGYLYTFYTQHHGVYFQDYMDVTLMLTYSIIGLHFGRVLLQTHSHAPKLDSFVLKLCNTIPIVVLLLFILDELHLATLVAFMFNTCFSFLTIILGVLAVRAKEEVANLYLISSVVAATCISISTAAVGGLVPYNSFTFKLIEVGMAFEGIVLAIVLANRFRSAQRDKELAENFARTDELTNIYNRRGFKYATNSLFAKFRYKNNTVAFLLLDIDRFKSVNDNFGHATGDLVIIQVAKLISKTIRNKDIVARWGGEEYVVLLPINNEIEALRLAEDLRSAISKLETRYFDETVKVTASIGVCVTTFKGDVLKNSDTEIFEKLISNADSALYQAKSNGRNNVCIYNSNEVVTKKVQA